MAALSGLGSPEVAADPLYRPETLPGKPKTKRTGKNGGELEQTKKKQKTQNKVGFSDRCGYGSSVGGI